MSQCLTCNSLRAGTVDDNFIFLDTSGNSNRVTQPPTHPPTPTNMSAHLGSTHVTSHNTCKPLLKSFWPVPDSHNHFCHLYNFRDSQKPSSALKLIIINS